MRLLAGVVTALMLLLHPAWAAEVELAVASAKAMADPMSGQPSIEVVLTPKSAKVFGLLTSENVGNVIELRVDGELLTSPVVREAILGGTLVITGDFTQESALALATRLADDGARIVLTPVGR